MVPGGMEQLKWHTYLPGALLLSTVAVLLLSTGVAPLYLTNDYDTWKCSQRNTLTNCVINGLGNDALIAWWGTGNRWRGPIQYSLGAIDLDAQSPRFVAVPTPYEPRNLALTHDGGAALVVDTAGNLHRHIFADIYTSGDLLVRLPGGPPHRLACSLDGRYLVSLNLHHVTVVDLAAEKILWERDDGEVTCFALHPTVGLVCGSSTGDVVELSLETGELVRRIIRRDASLTALAIDPSGEHVASLQRNGRVELIRLSDGQLQWSRKKHGTAAVPSSHQPLVCTSTLCFSPSGRYLVTAALEDQWVLAVWNTRLGDRVKTLHGHDKEILGAQFTPEGTLVSWSGDGTLRLWNVGRGSVRRVIPIIGSSETG